MPTAAEWLVFLSASALFALLPGPGILYVLARSLRGGRAEGVRLTGSPKWRLRQRIASGLTMIGLGGVLALAESR